MHLFIDIATLMTYEQLKSSYTYSSFSAKKSVNVSLVFVLVKTVKTKKKKCKL